MATNKGVHIASSTSWAEGRAPLLKPSTKAATEVVVSLSDIHVPYQDKPLVNSAIRLIKKLQPHRVVLNGDINDFFQLSRFNSGLERLDLLQDEIDEANALRARIRKAAPNAEIIETEGNHDSRLITYVAVNARALTSLRAIKPHALLAWDELEIKGVPGCGFRIRENFLIKHGSIIRSETGYSAKAELTAAGVSGLSGHTHRVGRYSRAGYITKEWNEQGCLCSLEPDYIVGAPNWEHGLAVGYFSTKSLAYHVDLVRPVGGKFFYGGQKL